MLVRLLLFLACSTTLASERPNVVFIITDDISPDDLSVYGSTIAQTPYLAEMSNTGLVFDNAYLTISSCSPSRCSMITGRYPHNTGAPELHTKLPPDQITFVQKLQDAGYYTVLSGKNHMGQPKALGFDDASSSGPSGAEKWVKHLQDRPKDQPFFAWFASMDAHRDFKINDKAPTYDPKLLQVPPMLFDGPGTREELAGYFHEVSRVDFYVGEVRKELRRQNIEDLTYIIFCSDNGRPFPRCKTYLYDSGIRTPLLICGPNVASGRTKSLVSSVDFSATILDLCHVDRPESIQGVSFAEVLKDPKAVTRNVAYAERNWHVYQNHARAVRSGDWLYVRNAFPDRPALSGESSWFSFPAVDELWKAANRKPYPVSGFQYPGALSESQALLTQMKQPAEMLFHVEDDPYQLHNVANLGHNYETLEKMRGLLDRWSSETGDSIPENPTPDRQALHDGKNRKMIRGEMPGAIHNADKMNIGGPVIAESDALPPESAELKVGMIGLDTSHCIAFAKQFNDPQHPDFISACRITMVYPQGSPDIESSVSRVPGYTKEIQTYGVQVVNDLDQMIDSVDAVLLETNDGRPHLQQIIPVLKAGKPCFIDKPVAGSLSDCIAIYKLAAYFDCPVFSSSSLRFSKGIQAARNGAAGAVTGCVAWSPCHIEQTHPDLFWYGIHGCETLFTVMGPGVKTVVRTQTANDDIVTGTWVDGRTGTFRGLRGGKLGYGGTVFGTDSIQSLGSYDGYSPLGNQIARFFQTGTPPVDPAETIDIYAFMEAAQESKRQNFQPVDVLAVLKAAESKADLAIKSIIDNSN